MDIVRGRKKNDSRHPKVRYLLTLNISTDDLSGKHPKASGCFLIFDVLFFLQPSGRFRRNCANFAILIFCSAPYTSRRHSLDGSVISSCYLTFAVLPLIYSAESTAKTEKGRGNPYSAVFLWRGIEREFRLFFSQYDAAIPCV